MFQGFWSLRGQTKQSLKQKTRINLPENSVRVSIFTRPVRFGLPKMRAGVNIPEVNLFNDLCIFDVFLKRCLFIFEMFSGGLSQGFFCGRCFFVILIYFEMKENGKKPSLGRV